MRGPASRWATRAGALVVLASLAPVLVGADMLYAVGTILLGANFLRHAFRVQTTDEPKVAMRMFGFSILYLFALFALLLIDHLLVGFSAS